MISFLIIPVHARIRPVEIGPAAVKPLQDIVNLCFLYAVTRPGAFFAEFLIRMDKHPQYILAIPQDPSCAATDDHAWSLQCHLPYHTLLCDIQSALFA